MSESQADLHRTHVYRATFIQEVTIQFLLQNQRENQQRVITVSGIPDRRIRRTNVYRETFIHEVKIPSCDRSADQEPESQLGRVVRAINNKMHARGSTSSNNKV